MILDEIDKRILRELQREGRLQNIELARRVGLSPSPCLRRVRLLEEAGIISRYVAVVDQAKVGLRLSMFARVWLTAQDAETIDHFIAAMRQLPEVVECYIMLGESDALLRVVGAGLDDYRRFQSTHLTRKNGIQNVKTDVPSETVKQTFALPLR
jgi:Lrp/AsnC family transcriptional regulator, leucine-responsive regulatory protein